MIVTVIEIEIWDFEEESDSAAQPRSRLAFDPQIPAKTLTADQTQRQNDEIWRDARSPAGRYETQGCQGLR